MTGDSVSVDAPVDALIAARSALQARQGTGARNDAPCAPARELSWARLGAAYFARKLDELPDAALWVASARPGWTRRRVIAACALHARALAQLLTLASGAPLDEVADTDEEALDLAETLPAHALRYLVTHAEIHLNVVWRDLSDAQWSLSLDGSSGAIAIHQTPALRARLLWASAVNLGSGGRMADAPADFRQLFAIFTPQKGAILCPPSFLFTALGTMEPLGNLSFNT